MSELDIFSRDHRRLAWLAMFTAALALVVGVLLYLTITEGTDTAEDVGANADAIAAQEAEQAQLDAQQAQLDRRDEHLRRQATRFEHRADTLFAYVKGLKPIPGAPGKDGLPSSLPGKDGADGRDGVDGATGQPGENGRDVTQAMADLALASYCAARNECRGAKGDTGGPGPGPTMAEITAAVIAYFATDEGKAQIVEAVNGAGCTAPPPDFVVTCPPPE